MKTNKRTEYITRDTILRLLSDDEVARVSTTETAACLARGDEYVDLEAPDHGVQRVLENDGISMGHVLPRKAVHEKTWRQIAALLSVHAIEDADARPR